MNRSRFALPLSRSALALLLFLGALPAAAGNNASPVMTSGRWGDSFSDNTGLEDLNQTQVSSDTVQLDSDVHQAWSVSSQVAFQAGQLSQVDADALPGALQLAPAALSFSPNRQVGSPSQVHDPYYDEPPVLVGDGGQTLHVAWLDLSEDDIFYRCSTDAGQNWTAIESLAGDGTTALQDAPDIAVASNGVVYAVWRDERLDVQGDIYMASRQGCGGSWSAATPVAVAASAGAAQVEPALAIASDDNLYLTWEENSAVYFSRSTNGGQGWAPAQPLGDSSADSAGSPRILVDPTGQTVTVAWAYEPAGGESNIYVAVSTDGGQSWPDGVPVAPSPTQSQYYPALARSASGTLYAAWCVDGIYFSRSLDQGQTWSAAIPVDDAPSDIYGGGTGLAVDSRGRIYLTWHDKRHVVYGYYPYYDVFMAYSQDGGQTWSANIQLNDDPVVDVGNSASPNPLQHYRPAAAVNQAGQLFVVWRDERDTCTNGGTECTLPKKEEVYYLSTAGYAFAPNGTFTSAVHDANGQATWDSISWTATIPASTTLTLHTRSGSTPVPDATWSGWSAAYLTSGQAIASPSARYIQARAILTTTDSLTTPVLYDLSVQYRPFVWVQTTQADFAGSIELRNVDVTTVPGSVQLSPDAVFAPERRVNDQVDSVRQAGMRPALEVAGDSIYLAWQDTRNDSLGDIFFARSTDAGQTWGSGIQVNDDGPGVEQCSPYLAARGSQVYLVWHDEREQSAGDVYFARSTNGGLSWSANSRVNSALSVAGWPSIAVGADTRLHVSWATSKTVIYTNRSTDGGQSWGENVLVGGVNIGPSSTFSGYPAPGIAADGSGTIYLAWWDTRDGFFDLGCYCLRDMDVFASRSLDNGATWGTDIQITGEDGVAGQGSPALAYRDGTLFTLWVDQRDHDITDTPQPAIYFGRSVDGGQSWDPTNVQVSAQPVGVTPLHTLIASSVIAASTSGALYAGWASDHLDGAGDVFFSSSRDGGDTWQAERRVNTDIGGAAQGPPALVTDADGRVYMAWHDERSGSQDLYFTASLTGTTYTSGALLSSVLDSEGAAQWGNLAWTATTLPGTGLTFYTRSGNSTTPDDGTWSGWSPGYGSSPGAISSPPARYLQYRAVLTTTDPYTTPVLHDVSVEYGRYPSRGSAVSIPVTPPSGFREWQAVTFSSLTPAGTTLSVDVLDGAGNVLLEGVTSGASLSAYPAAQYPNLRLRVNLTTSDPQVTPALNDWALTWYPPPSGNHVRVVYENGGPAGSANVYRNGSFLGGADHLGYLDLAEPLQVGDSLTALQPLAETPTYREGHEGWAYRTYITNIELAASGDPQSFVVTQPGAQTLTVRAGSMLVLFNLVVSIEWDATDDYMEEIAQAAQSASDYLYDMSDGQMAFGNVAIYDNGEYWADADIQVSTKNIVRPHAYVGGITSDDKSHVIRVGRGWDGHSGNQGRWDEPIGFRTLGHEFGHYALYLYDEYFAYSFDRNGDLAGEIPSYCTGLENRNPAGDATNASLMDYQYTSSELSARGVAGMWSSSCEMTAQWQLNPTANVYTDDGESTWETIARKYADTANPARWQVVTPAEREGVMAGPSDLPELVLSFPAVTSHNSGVSGAPRHLVIYDHLGNPYWGAIVALYKQDGRVIGQGFTNGDGRLDVYGADTGDTLRASSMDAGLSGSVVVGTATDLVLSLAPVASLGAQAVGGIPHMRVVAEPSLDPSQVDLFIFLLDFGPGADPSVIVSEPGGEVEHGPSLSYSPGTDIYSGEISFNATERGTGRIRTVGEVGSSLVRLQSTYRLQRVLNDRDQDVYSDDGNLSLHLERGSLPSEASYMVVMPPGAGPGPAPAGLALVGDVYDVTASGALTELAKPAVLTLRLDGALISSSSAPPGLGVYRWDPNSQAWRALVGEFDETHKAMVTTVQTLGAYALMAPPGEWRQNDIFLPVIVKHVP
jgi:hypothetical protein